MPREVMLDVDGILVRTEAGISLAAALARAGRIALRRSPHGTARGAFCGMGMCFECRVRVDGVERLACLVRVGGPMRVCTDA